MEKMGRGGLEFSRDVLINPLSSLFSSPYQYLIINMKKSHCASFIYYSLILIFISSLVASGSASF